MEIGVTRDAAAYIAERGSRIYLWQEPFGRAWDIDRVALDDPSLRISFSGFPISGVTVLVAGNVDPPKTLYVSVQRFPHARLRIEWDGDAWGSRGGAHYH